MIKSYVHSSNKQNTYLKINDMTYVCSYVNDKIIRNKNYVIRNTNDENILYLYFIEKCIEYHVTLQKYNGMKVSFTNNDEAISNLSYCETIKYYKTLRNDSYFTIELNYDDVDDLYCVDDLPIGVKTHIIDYKKNKNAKHVPATIPISADRNTYMSIVKSTQNDIYVNYYVGEKSFLYNCNNENIMCFDKEYNVIIKWIVANDAVNRKYMFTFIC